MKMKYLIITISTIFLANCASTSLELPESYTEESKKEGKTIDSIDPFKYDADFIDMKNK